jgi:hypothetical protein
VMLTQSPESSLSCRAQVGCLSLLTSETCFDSLLENSTVASEYALLSSDGFLFRTPFWKARTDSSLLIEKIKINTDSYKPTAVKRDKERLLIRKKATSSCVYRGHKTLKMYSAAY